MPKPFDPERFKERKDGLWERRGLWEEATVGSKILGNSGRRGDVWEVLQMAAGSTPAEFGHTLWMQVKSLEDGRVANIPPRWGRDRVTFVCESPDDPDPLPPPSTLADAEKLALLVERLGAVELMTKDNATGEIHCPDYEGTFHQLTDRSQPREHVEHLRIFHGIDAGHLDAAGRVEIHGQAHDPRYPRVGKGPIPHRHMPERHRIFG